MSPRLASVTLPDDVRAVVDGARSLTVPASRAELYELALGPEGGPRFSVDYAVGDRTVTEATVVRCAAPTSARPGDRVIVTGAGPVGYLGSQIFRAAGYEVHVVDPVPARQSAVRASGVENVYERVPVEDPALARTFALALECSGHEQAVLDAARVVRKGGEVALVGVPWARRVNISAQTGRSVQKLVPAMEQAVLDGRGSGVVAEEFPPIIERSIRRKQRAFPRGVAI